MVFCAVPIQVFEDILQSHRKIALGGGVKFILCLYSYGVGRGIGFVIKQDSGFKATVLFEGKEVVVSRSILIHQVVGNTVSVRIGGIELSHDGTHRLVFSYS